VPFDEVVQGLRGLPARDDQLERELRALDQEPRDPFP
jgi:hypothetical protein